MGIMSGTGAVRTNFIDYNRDKMEKQMRLDQVIDRLNKLGGSELVVLGAQQYREKDGQGHHVAFTDAIRHDFKSKNPTTRWSDIITPEIVFPKHFLAANSDGIRPACSASYPSSTCSSTCSCVVSSCFFLTRHILLPISNEQGC
ncbi:MAG: DUF4113 domain-containing protein [Hoylesella buccalis]